MFVRISTGLAEDSVLPQPVYKTCASAKSPGYCKHN
jgi:hypothetical protein